MGNIDKITVIVTVTPYKCYIIEGRGIFRYFKELMKRFAFFLLFLVFLAGVVWGQTKIWNGGLTGNWDNNNNWNPIGVPVASDDVIINSGAVTFNTSITVRSLRIDAGASLIGSGNICRIQVGTAAQPGSLSLIANGQITAYSLNVYGICEIGANIYTYGSRSTTANGIITGQDYRGAVTLADNVTLTATQNVNVGGTVRFRGTLNGAYNLTIDGNAWIGGNIGTTIPRLLSILVENTSGIVNHTTRISAASIITNGNQIYNSTVILETNNKTLNAGTNQVILGNTGNGRLSGNYSLTITGTVTFNGTSGTIGALSVIGDTTFQTAPLNAASVSVDGQSNISTNITTTIATGNGQNYDGNVTLGVAAINLAGGVGSTIRFGETVNGNSALTITNANVEFNNTVGNTGTGLININVANGETRFSNNAATSIRTSGNQSYAAVNFGAVTRTLTSINGSVTASGIVSGTAGVTVNAAMGISMIPSITTNYNNISGAITLNNNQLTPSTGNITFNTTLGITLNAINNSNNGSINISRSGALQIDSLGTSGTGGSITLGSSGGTVGAVTQTGVISTNNLAINSSGAINLATSDNIVNTLTISGAGGQVQFRNNTALIIGNINNVGANNVTITVDAGAITQTTGTAITTTGTLSLSGGGAITLNNANNNVGTLAVTAAGGAVQFRDSNALVISNVNAGTYNVTITVDAGAITQTTGTAITTTGTLSLSGGGAITLNNANNNVGTLAVTAAGGAVQFRDSNTLVLGAISTGAYSVTITVAAGTITQTTGTAIATTGTLSLSSGGAITLNNANNVNVLNVSVSGSGGPVLFTNTGTFAVSGINASNSVVEITASSNNINITGEIICDRLSLSALNGALNIGNTIRVFSNDVCAVDEPQAAAHFKAASLTGGSNITISSIGGKVCAEISSSAGYTGNILNASNTVSNDRIHYHFPHTTSNIVYRTGADNQASHGVTVGSYLYLRADSNLGQDLTANATGNIYIINVPSGTANAYTRNIDFEAGGYIEFRDAYVSTGDFNIQSTLGSIRLNNASINIYNNNFNFNSYTITLIGTTGNPPLSEITASSITLGHILSSSGTYNSLTLNGTTALNGGSNINTLKITGNTTINEAMTTNISFIDITALNSIDIKANISTTGTGTAQIYNGPVILSGDRQLSGVQGSTIQFLNSVNSSASPAAASALIITTAAVTFNSTVGGSVPLASLSAAAAAINAGANITTNNAQVYSGTVTVSGGNRILKGSSVTFNGNITGGGGLEIFGSAATNAIANFYGINNTGALTVHGTANISSATTNAVLINVKGTTVFNATAAVTTSTGGQIYEEAVTLNAGVNFAGNSGTLVDFQSTINGDNSLTVTTANVRFGGIVGGTAVTGTSLASISVNSGQTIIDTQNITTRGAQNFHGPVMLGNNVNFTADSLSLVHFYNTINHNGTARTLQITDADVQFDGNVGANASASSINPITSVDVTGTGRAVINANIYTSGYQNYGGPVSIINSGTVLLSSSAGNGNINLNSTAVPAITGTGNFTITAGTGNITIAGQIGEPSSRIGNITVNNSSAGEYVQNGSVFVNGYFIKSGNGYVNLADSVNIDVTNYICLESDLTLLGDATFTLPVTGGYFELIKLITNNNNSLTLTGGSEANSFEIRQLASQINIEGNITISSGSYVKLRSGTIVSQTNARSLTLQAGNNINTVLDVSPGIWQMGSGTLPSSNSFSGINGNLILGGTNDRNSRTTNSSKLITNDLYLTSSTFYIKQINPAQGWVFICALGNVNITSVNLTSSDINLPYLIFEMDGGNPYVPQTLRVEQTLGSLHVGADSRTILNTNGNTVYFRGEVIINASSSPAGLDAGNYDIVMHAGLEGKRGTAPTYLHNGSNDVNYTRWEIPNVLVGSNAYPSPPFAQAVNMNNFVFRQSYDKKVSFQRDVGTSFPVFFEIAGNTMWQSLECRVEGAVIQFSRHPDHHTILYKFLIGPDNPNYPSSTPHEEYYVTITRLNEESDYSSYPYIYNKSTMTPNSTVGNLDQWALPAFPPPYDLKQAGDAELSKYWNINFIVTPGFRPLDKFKYVRIFFSHGYNSRIPIESHTMNLDVIPYYDRTTKDGFFNYDWIELKKILYSFTEDYNGNGRLDRIRVQTNIPLNGNFSDFDVKVEGYEIDRSKGVNGFEMVWKFTNTEAFDADSFYIYLIESPNIDTGNTPLWSVTRNTSLRDALVEMSLVGEPNIDINIKPFDTIPPRIAYTLTLPGQSQTYVRMSEPVELGSFSDNSNLRSYQTVEGTNGYDFIWKYYEVYGSEIDFYSPISPANIGYLLQWQNPYSVSSLVGLKNIYGEPSALNSGYFSIQNMIDQSVRAMDWRDSHLDDTYYYSYSSPKYPLNWAYTAYAKVNGNQHMWPKYPDFNPDDPNAEIAGPNPNKISKNEVFLPPYQLLTAEMMTKIASGNGKDITPSSFTSNPPVIRRITDVLVSIPPDNANSQNYFAWPVWARYQVPPNTPGYNSNNQFWGQSPTDTGIIWVFDGTAYLEAEDVDIQARINSSLTNLGLSLELFWVTNVPAQLRIPAVAPARGRYTGGLWLPGLNTANNNQLLYNFAPALSGTVGKAALTASASPLFVFQIAQNNPPGYSSGEKIEFVFRFSGAANSDMFIARLDPQNADTVPWYQRVRPFGFDIQNIRLQRGGVTILNNVIVPITEHTYIRYNLIRPGRVTIQVHTLDGTLVRSIRRNEYRESGEWTDAWNGTNNSGMAVARGMYYIRIVGPDIDEIRQVMVVR